MSGLDTRTRRRQPAGTILALQAELGCGRLERIHARRGTFEATYGQHAIVVSDVAPRGPILHNGRAVPAKRTDGPVYSVFQPNDHIAGRLDDEISYEIVLLCPSFVEELLRSEFGAEQVQLSPAVRVELPPLAHLLWRRFRAAIDQPAHTAQPIIRFCLELLIVKMVEGQLGVPNPSEVGARIDAVNKAVAFIDANIGERIDVRAIAASADLSPNYFSRLFQGAYGISVHRFVLDRRLQKARTLLSESGLSISQIALDLGFSSQSHLTTAFRQRFGSTPAQFRLGGGPPSTGRKPGRSPRDEHKS